MVGAKRNRRSFALESNGADAKAGIDKSEEASS